MHSKLIAYLGEAIQTTLPSDLRARAEERVLLETLDKDPIATFRSDVALVTSPRGAAGGTTAATIEPFLVDYFEGPEAPEADCR